MKTENEKWPESPINSAHSFTEGADVPRGSFIARDLPKSYFIREMQMRVFEWAKLKGWCDRVVPVPEQCALIHSEVSEALEAWRKKEPISWTDGETKKPEGVASEYADVVIRVMHYCALLGIDLDYEMQRKMNYNDTRPFRHGNKQG